MERCVIVLSGPMADAEAVRPLVRPEDFVICADGGLDRARSLGFTPRLLVGDLDSLAGAPPQGLPLLRYRAEKDETDTELAIDWALAKGYRDFLLLGGLGGRLDHTVANFSALLHLRRNGAEGRIADGGSEARMLLAGSLHLPRRDGWYVSVFPFEGEAEGVTERGLRYSLTDARLRGDRTLGVSNEFTDTPEAVISVEKGPLLILLSKK